MRYLRDTKSGKIMWLRISICVLGVLTLILLVSGFWHLYLWRSMSEEYSSQEYRLTTWSKHGTYQTPQSMGIKPADTFTSSNDPEFKEAYLEGYQNGFVAYLEHRVEWEKTLTGVSFTLIALPVSIASLLIALFSSRDRQQKTSKRKKGEPKN